MAETDQGGPPGLPEEARRRLEEFDEIHVPDPEPELLEALEVREYGEAGEKETHIWLDSDSGEARVSTSQRPPIRSLLKHRYAEIEDVHLTKQDGDLYISGVKCSIPFGSVTVKATKRSNDYLSGVFPA